MTCLLTEYHFRHNIRCNAVLPGFIETPMLATVPEKVKEKFKALIPFARMGTPEGLNCFLTSHLCIHVSFDDCFAEVAEVVLFLASDRSSYVTGNCIEVSGGFAT